MKKLILFLGIFLISLSSFGQLTISQSLTPTTGLKVGDTITVKYTLTKGQVIKNPRYLWFRYQYNNKALTYVSTVFNQGTSAQTFYTGWNNYKFTFNGGASDNDLDVQYGFTPWNYTVNSDWNVGQLTVQRADASISGIIATQKYILKDQNTYNNIFKLDLATGTDTAGLNVGTIYGGGWSSLSGVVGNTSQFKVKVLFPQGYTITDHSVQLMRLQSNGSGNIDWSQQPIAQLPLDASGEALFTTQVKVGDSVVVFVGPAMTKTWMNNIVTVSDAYKAFLGHSQTDISGTPNFFTLPVLEKKVGKVTNNANAFGEADSYALFAHVMGQDMTSVAMIPTNTSTSVRWYSGLLNQSWLDGVVKNKVLIDSPIKEVYAVFAWGGDLNWSHSSDPAVIASRISAGQYTNSVNQIGTNSIKSMSSSVSMAYQTEAVETAKLGVSSTLEGGKVILTTTLTKAELAGLQVIMNYDESKLTLDNVIFDAGSTITNFSTHENGRLTFGSIDQLKTARIKVGTPYKLIFTPKTTLTNTAGLFYFVLSDAVDAKGNKVDLIVE
ncbi:MAG: hypothetical protein ACKOWO_05395 [Sediminibacterium sp.]